MGGFELLISIVPLIKLNVHLNPLSETTSTYFVVAGAVRAQIILLLMALDKPQIFDAMCFR
ncbi:MAG TPA: hypothetical protein DIW64_12535 [Cellvibrio sp.]|nr:hypothetical protein [Cellvibrio sp.]